MLFCLSFASKGNARVEELKAGIEAQGHRVFYGPDIRSAIAIEHCYCIAVVYRCCDCSAMAPEDWRLQWMQQAERAHYCVNFLSAAYVR